MHIKTITAFNIRYKIFTALSSSFLSIILPNIPPTTPPAAITTKIYQSNCGTLPAINEYTSDAIWEIRIIQIEFLAATFVFIEKKNDKITRLIGPPPMPKNDDITPKNKPIIINAKILFISTL